MGEFREIGSVVPFGSADIIKIRGTIEVQPNSETKVLDYDTLDLLELHESFKLWRGEIITNSISVEEKIEEIIIKLLFRKEVDGANLFRSIVLTRDSFSFMQKCKVFSDLLKNLLPFKERDYSSLIQKIHDIINTRNEFAHGKVNYEGAKAEKIVVDYFKEKPRSEEINTEVIEKFSQKCRECYTELDAILTEVHKTYCS